MTIQDVDALPGIERIRERFLDLLEERLDALDDAMVEFDFPATGRASLVRAQNILHKIAGAAGTLGFNRLGESARHCEESIITHLKQDEPTLDVLYRDIGAFATQAEALLERRAGTTVRERVP
jgi:chemotaxis protein histidine kinase CheA